jgi:hypothetical protein
MLLPVPYCFPLAKNCTATVQRSPLCCDKSLEKCNNKLSHTFSVFCPRQLGLLGELRQTVTNTILGVVCRARISRFELFYCSAA